MSILLYLSLIFIIFGLVCEQLERESKKWYFDRLCLRLAGLFYGAAISCAVFAFTI